MNRIIIFSMLIMLVSGCSKEETRQYDFKGDLKGHITLYDDTGSFELTDNDSININIEGTDPEVNIYADNAGNYLIEDLPLGTYNIIFSKTGFYPLKFQNIKFEGGYEPSILNVFLRKECSVIVKDYAINLENNRLSVTGTISHDKNIEIPGHIYQYSLQLYIGKSEDVSMKNNNWSYVFFTQLENDTVFDYTRGLDATFLHFFPSGSVIFTVIVGTSSGVMQTYNYETDSYETYGYGSPSEIKSFIVP